MGSVVVDQKTGNKPKVAARVQRLLPPSVMIALGLTLLPFLVFWAEAIGLRVFYYHDVQYYFYPYHKLVVDITSQGHVPLWNPHSFSGIPLLGDGQTAIFYPPNWIFWLLPPIHALAVVVLLQFSIAGVGMFAYIRQLRMGLLAATVAALVFMFNGFLAARVVHLSIMSGAALIPVVFFGTDHFLQRRSYGAFVIAAVAVALQAVSGHPQVPAYTAVAVGVYVLVLAGQRARRNRRWRSIMPLLQLGAVYVVACLLAAIQLLPWGEFARFSPRAAGASYGFVTNESIRWWDWLLFLFPYGLGGMRTTWLQSMPEWTLPIYLWERLGYVGLLPLALALVGLTYGWRIRKEQIDALPHATVDVHTTRFMALLAVLVVSALFAAGDSTPFGRLVYALPVVGSLRGYARAVVLVSFVLAVLTAYGIERLRLARQPVQAAWWSGALLLATVAGVIVIAGLLPQTALDRFRQPLHREMFGTVLRPGNANAVVPLLLAIISAGVLWWLRTGITRTKAIVVLCIIAVDLIGVASTFNPTTDPDVFARVPPSVEFLQSDPDLFRVAVFITTDTLPVDVAQRQLAISWALPYGIDEINGFNSLQPRRYTDVLFGPEVGDVSYGFLHDERLLQENNYLLAMLDVKYIVVQPQTNIVPPPAWERVYVDDAVSIYRNPNWRGRAWLAEWVVNLPTADTVLAGVRHPGFQPWQIALLEDSIDPQLAQRLSQTSGGEVRVERHSPNELIVHTQAYTERFLVLSEMWFPGWRAELDGATLPIYRTNYILRGLVVPAGEHTIRMVYRPGSVIGGAATTVATAVGLAIGALVWRRVRPAKCAIGQER